MSSGRVEITLRDTAHVDAHIDNEIIGASHKHLHVHQQQRDVAPSTKTTTGHIRSRAENSNTGNSTRQPTSLATKQTLSSLKLNATRTRGRQRVQADSQVSTATRSGQGKENNFLHTESHSGASHGGNLSVSNQISTLLP